jgi:hypothetical protein
MMGSGSVPDVWYVSSPLQEEKSISQEELNKFAQGILNLVMPDISMKDQLKQLFSLSRRTVTHKREVEFYDNNQNNKKGVTDLRKYNQALLKIIEVKSSTSTNGRTLKRNSDI